MISMAEEKRLGWADLHLHTTRSDGIFTPTEMMQKAAESELVAVSITDHDEVGGIEEAQQTGQKLGIEIIPGVEFSTFTRQLDVHILGYFIDYRNQEILRYIHLFQQERLKRAEKIVAKLHDMGLKLSLDFILQKAGAGSVGRPHIADALMEKGYVLSYDEAFYKYLGDGKPAYVPKYKISTAEAVQLIRRAGGLAFLAHPGMDMSNEDVIQLIKMGIDGIEILHPSHSEGKINYFYQLAVKNNLLVSGGSDCHGDRKGNTTIGKYNIPYRFVIEMKKALEDTIAIGSPELLKGNENGTNSDYYFGSR